MWASWAWAPRASRAAGPAASRKKGKYEFGWLDEAVDGLCEQGIRPWMCLAYGNPGVRGPEELGIAHIHRRGDAAGLGTLCDGRGAPLQAGRVSEWEVWNEPNLRGADQSAAYAELLIRTAEAVRKVDPEAVIIGFGLSRMPLDSRAGCWTSSASAANWTSSTM